MSQFDYETTQGGPPGTPRLEETVVTDTKTGRKYRRGTDGHWMEVKHAGPERRRDARLKRRLARHSAYLAKLRKDPLFRLAEHEEYLRTL